MDHTQRRAAIVSALIALPVALVAGLLVFTTMHDRAGTAPADAPTLVADPTGSVPMAAPTLAPAHATMCLAFIAALPRELRNLPERHVTAGAEQNIAYGNPPITASCGGPAAKVGATDELYSTDDVCWHTATTAQGSVWTTVDRETPVTVTVPASYDAPGQWANEFTDAIISALPRITTPYHC